MSFRDARLKAGKTVQDVVDSLGVTDAAVYMWETRKTVPKTKHLKRLAELYNTSIDDLLREEE